ncbi:MAG: ribokinase, partial [Patescibacteria group bacterium]
MPEIVVVGSINMDLVATAPHAPAPGETVLGGEFRTIPGGKGANQAYGAARLGGRVAMVGRLGDDAFGRQSLANLAAAGVDTVHIGTIAGSASGVALIVVDDAGNNSIVVAPGANSLLGAEDVEAAAPLFAEARVLLVQLEVPLPAVAKAVGMARDMGLRVILDPAPARPLPDDLLARVDYLTPNQNESEVLTGIRVVDRASALEAGRLLRRRGVGCALVKLGGEGVVVLDGGSEYHLAGHRVKAVDTTAAGDAFAAGL